LALMHQIWLDVVKDPSLAGAHHYHVVGLALEELRRELNGEQRAELLRRLEGEVHRPDDGSPPKSLD